MKKTLLLSLALTATCAVAHAQQPQTAVAMDSVYVFTYSDGPGDGLHVAYSADRQRWTPVGTNHAVFTSDFGAWGSQKKMYDPDVLYTDGRWYAVFGLNGRHQFATTQTANLAVWKPQDYPYMSVAEAISRPIVTKRDGQFEVLYTTPEGHYYVTRSADYSHWSAAQAISEQTYNAAVRRETCIVEGAAHQGRVNRAPYAAVEQLRKHIADVRQRNSTYSENTGQDEARFRGVESLKAALHIQPDHTKAISPDLIGIFFEDINYSADGGLYAELVQNRDFEYNALDRREWDAKSFWTLRGDGTTWTISTDAPLHANNAHYAVLATERTGAALENAGFDGIPLRRGDKYDLNLWVKTVNSATQRLRVALKDSDKVLAQTVITVPAGGSWRQQKAVLRPTATADKAVLVLEPLTAGTIGVDFVSLFPQATFKGRANGMRADLAQTLADMHPRFVRFPGGCVSHGNGLENMYRWRSTIGPLWERKTQSNIWGYHQSKGLGFYEYFQFCEDIGAQPLPVLPAAVCCQNSSRDGDGQQGGLPMEQLDDYVQELFDLVEWANGDPAKSQLARMRAEAGHPKPFNLRMLGVGNEDLISDTFTERFNYIFEAFRRQHPEITIVGTVGPFFEGSDYEYGWQLAQQKNVPVVDEHYYVSPGWYVHNQTFYDKYARGGTKVYLGEWASRGNRLENALAEALHITNLERNADVVVMSSYAPLLAKHGHTQWNPDLIYFNNTAVFPTVNYEVQRLCGQNNGDAYVQAPLTVSAVREQKETPMREAALRVNSSVVTDSSTGDMIIKLVNYTPLATAVAIDLPSAADYKTQAAVHTLAGKPSDRDLRASDTTMDVSEHFEHTLPPYSFTVIRLKSATKR